MSKPRQHINPRRDLSRFTDENGCFYYLDRGASICRISYRNPKSVMWRRGYYGIEEPIVGEDPDWVESSLQRSEEQANRLIDSLLEQIATWKSAIPDECSEKTLESLACRAIQTCPLGLNRNEAGILKLYIAWKFMRSDRRKQSEVNALEVVKKGAAKRFGQEKVDALDPQWLASYAHDTSNRIVGEGPTSFMRNAFANKGLLVSTAIGNRVSPFVAGDNAVLQGIPDGKNLLDRDSEISMPISRDSMLSIYGSPGVQFYPRLTNANVRHINEGTFFQSKEVACRSKKVLESLFKAFKKRRLYMQSRR